MPTVEACQEIDKLLELKVYKNLFLRNAQRTGFYLLMLPGSKKFKTSVLSRQQFSPIICETGIFPLPSLCQYIQYQIPYPGSVGGTPSGHGPFLYRGRPSRCVTNTPPIGSHTTQKPEPSKTVIDMLPYHMLRLMVLRFLFHQFSL